MRQNIRITEATNRLYWDLRKAVSRAAHAAREAQIRLGREAGETQHLQARAEAYAHALSYLKQERQERKRGAR